MYCSKCNRNCDFNVHHVDTGGATCNNCAGIVVHTHIAELAKLREENQRLQVIVDGLHIERDDYYNLYHKTLSRERQAKIEALREIEREVNKLVDSEGSFGVDNAYETVVNQIKKQLLEETDGR